MDFIQFHSILYKQKLEILDAGRSPTLVRPAAPLAACVLRHRCTSYRTLTPSTECHRKSVLWIKPTKIGCHGSVPWWIEMLILYWSVIIYNHSSLPILQIWRRPVKQNLMLVWIRWAWGYAAADRTVLKSGNSTILFYRAGWDSFAAIVFISAHLSSQWPPAMLTRTRRPLNNNKCERWQPAVCLQCSAEDAWTPQQRGFG